MNKIVRIVDISGEYTETPDFPVAIVREHADTVDVQLVGGGKIVDPVFTHAVTDNLYGRVMTMVEATTDPSKLQAVKDVFGQALNDWSAEVYRSAREIANGGDSSGNIYTRKLR